MVFCCAGLKLTRDQGVITTISPSTHYPANWSSLVSFYFWLELTKFQSSLFILHSTMQGCVCYLARRMQDSPDYAVTSHCFSHFFCLVTNQQVDLPSYSSSWRWICTKRLKEEPPTCPSLASSSTSISYSKLSNTCTGTASFTEILNRKSLELLQVLVCYEIILSVC